MKAYPYTFVSYIRFFEYRERFVEHARDHFFNPEEPWDRLFGRKALARHCQNLGKGAVSLSDELYDTAAEVLGKGITFSTECPVYAVISEIMDTEVRANRRVVTTLFLSKEGFVVVCRDNIVRSAYFVNSSPRDSYHSLFKDGWRKIKAKCAKVEYFDNKNRVQHEVSEIIRESEKNWDCCPNPHVAPRTRATTAPHYKAFYRRLERYENYE